MKLPAPVHKLMLLLFSIFLIAAFFSCNGGPIQPEETLKYHVKAVLVVDPNLDSTLVAADFRAGDSILSDAQVSLAGKPLTFNSPTFIVDSVFSFKDDSISVFRANQYGLRLSDADNFSDTIPVTVADTFTMVVVLPPPPSSSRSMMAGSVKERE